MDLLVAEKQKFRTDTEISEVFAAFAKCLLEDFEYDEDAYIDDELEDGDDRGDEICELVRQIRYKLIKQVGHPIRDNWIELVYHWYRRQLGQV
jgi:hypothetical protein